VHIPPLTRCIHAAARPGNLGALLSALAIVVWAGAVQGQAIDSKPWVTNGYVKTMARIGNTLYIGGGFTVVGPATGAGVPIDAGTGAPVVGFPKVTGTVYAAVPDGVGGWFIGGLFTAVGGVPRRNLAHVGSDLHVFAWDPSPDLMVRALIMQGGVLYVGGGFTGIGGQTRQGIAAVDTSTGLATAWYPGAINVVYTMATLSNTLYVGGIFSSVGVNTRSNIAAIDIPTAAVKSWAPNADAAVRSLSVSGSTVYAGGSFTAIGGASRNRIAAVDATTGLATGWNPNANSTVRAVVASATTVYVGGDFTTVGGQTRNYIAEIDAVDGSATSWNPNANAAINCLAKNGAKVYAGGGFSIIGGQFRRAIAELDVSTAAANPWNPFCNGFVETLAIGGPTVFAGGTYTSLGGVSRSNLAAIDLSTGAATAWNPNSGGLIEAMTVAGSTVYVGGSFTSGGAIGGAFRNRIAALDAATGLATSWNPNANGIVRSLAVSGGAVYAGGDFTSIGGQPRNRIAALDATNGTATGWNPDAGAPVLALATSGPTVYAGGSFSAIGGQSRNYLAALDAGTGLATSWNPSPNAQVKCVAVRGGTVYAGGSFSTLGGQTRNRVGAVDAATGFATPWDPNPNGDVNALAVGSSTIYAGGEFGTIGGQQRIYLAALDATTGAARSWNADTDHIVYTLSLGDAWLYAGGLFTAIKTQPQGRLAAIAAAPTLQSVAPASGGNAGPVTPTIYGEGLAPGLSISLGLIGQPIIPGVNATAAADGSNLNATFDLDGALPGQWDVTYYGSDGQSAVLENGFTIEGVEAPQLRVAIVGTSLFNGSPAVRRDRRTALDLVIENPGNVDAVSVPLWLAGVPLDATVELDFPLSYPLQVAGEPNWSTVPLFFTSPSGKYVPIVIPRVPPGTTTRRFYLTVPGPTHPPFQLIAAVAPPWVDGEVFRSCLSPAAGIANPNCMGTQLVGINGHLTGNPGFQAMSGVAWWAKVAWQCEGEGTLSAALLKAEQVLDYLEGPVQSGTATAGCENVSRPIWRDVMTITVVGSIDPNDKLGLQGSFSGQTVLPYSIRFENFSTATAPAQDVIVTDQLNPNVLDLSTISLDQITFGNRHIYPPPGLSSFSTTVDLRPQKNLLVNVSASLDPVTHVLSWYFNSIDPATGRTPTDFQVGFLPPNLAPPEGEGSVMFTVIPLPGLATGTQISNAASILFDDPPALTTAAWTNGVDNSPPASHVLPLAPQSNQPSIQVSWTAPGAPPDLRDFTVYVKQDNGPYRVWRLNTPTTTDTLVPPKDHLFHTFTFYSVARDQIGNMEAPPSVPDATTQSTTAVGTDPVTLLELAGARPNPARGAIHVWLSLPSRQPAMLELLDVAGRRIARRDVGLLGPGSHLVTLTPSPAPRAGLYFLRLVQGDRELKARVALIR
jgi:trimeric autotransporter adhesin